MKKLMSKPKLNLVWCLKYNRIVHHNELVSPIIIIPKNNGQIQICHYFLKLNTLSFIDSIVHVIVWHKCYSFLDGFSSYLKSNLNSSWKSIKDHFHHGLGHMYVYWRMPFGLPNALVIFQIIMTKIYNIIFDYLWKSS